MDNFDEIIKQKAEQFEVPFNDAHWAEMDGRLNAIRAAKIKNTILLVAQMILHDSQPKEWKKAIF